ncbi:16413_t:CDS:10, partial [Funneliformis mosseae]
KVDIFDKDHEVSRYIEDIKCIKTHYNYNSKHIYDIIQNAENNIKCNSTCKRMCTEKATLTSAILRVSCNSTCKRMCAEKATLTSAILRVSDEETSPEVMEFLLPQGSSNSNENEGEGSDCNNGSSNSNENEEEGSDCNNGSHNSSENEGEGSKALVYDILKDIISASQAEKNNLQDRVLHEVFDEIDDYITDEIHNYLTDFFNTDRGHQGWCEVARSITICEEDSEQLKDTKGLLKDTFGRFIKAFSLGPLNPLRNISTLERPHLNQFVHPLIDSSLWIFAGINYISGEIPLKGKIKSNADGIGFLNDVSDYQIACMEGAKPGARKKKIIDDDTKNIRNMTQLFNNIIVSEATERRQIYTDLRTYGATAYKTEISLTMMDFRMYRLFEVDRFSLPKDWVDIPNFVFVYEALIKWAVCAHHTREGLIAQRKKRRIGRYSESRIVKKLNCLK